VFTLWLLVFGVGSQAMLIAPIIPQIATQLTIDEAALGTLITAYSVAVGAFALLVGPISDRIGRRPVLLAGTGLMTAALAAHRAGTGGRWRPPRPTGRRSATSGGTWCRAPTRRT
jgi:predicted MFS family arabinose efflux permease